MKERMAVAGLTHIQLAVKAQIAYKTVYNVLSGKKEPRPSIIGRLASALDTTPEYLLTGKGERAVGREDGVTYGVDQGTMVRTLRDAMDYIAHQLRMPEARVAEKISELVKESVRKPKDEG